MEKHLWQWPNFEKRFQNFIIYEADNANNVLLYTLRLLDSVFSHVEQCLKYMPTQILSDYSSSHHHLKSDKF